MRRVNILIVLLSLNLLMITGLMAIMVFNGIIEIKDNKTVETYSTKPVIVKYNKQ